MRNARRPTPECQEHYLVDSFLPWYVNQTLSEEINTRVATHVQQCRRCSDELARLRLIQTEVDMPPPDAPVASHDGLEHILSRIKAQQ